MGCCASSESNPKTNSEIQGPQASTTPPQFEKNSNQQKGAPSSKKDGKGNDKENSRSSTNLSWNLDGDVPDQRKVEFQLKMSQKKSEIEEEAKQLAELKNKAFEEQVSRQKAQAFVGLYDLFQHHATNYEKTRMNIDGVTQALKTFGMIIDNDKGLQKLVFSKFDIENEREIDYNDFMATMSSLIGTKNEDALMLMFQIFDIDQDGYLNTEDIARILLAQNQIAVIVTGKSNQLEEKKKKRVLSKNQCLKVARKLITKYDSDDFQDDQISFDEFVVMMMNTTTEEMMIDNMPSLSSITMEPKTPPLTPATPPT